MMIPRERTCSPCQLKKKKEKKAEKNPFCSCFSFDMPFYSYSDIIKSSYITATLATEIIIIIIIKV